MEFKHKPVLLEETIQGLNIKENGIYVDGTLGGAGHSKEILKQLSSKGLLIGIDRDEEALKAAQENLNEYQNVKYIHGNHDEIEKILEQLGIQEVDGILLDLGVSSYQLDERKRGFSYLGNNELDMRMDKNQTLTAKKVVNKVIAIESSADAPTKSNCGIDFFCPTFFSIKFTIAGIKTAGLTAAIINPNIAPCTKVKSKKIVDR